MTEEIQLKVCVQCTSCGQNCFRTMEPIPEEIEGMSPAEQMGMVQFMAEMAGYRQNIVGNWVRKGICFACDEKAEKSSPDADQNPQGNPL